MNLKIITKSKQTRNSMNSIKHIETELKTLRDQINTHQMYGELSSIEDVKLFMQNHVFAVWDFMSLLKALQSSLTSTTIPWTPKGNGTAARFINEIVMDEESDVNENGEVKSHFEMYIDSMDQIHADTAPIKKFTNAIRNGASIDTAATMIKIHPTIKAFLDFTFGIIAEGKVHCIAAAFTFGREDVIPDMFLKIIQQSKTSPEDGRYSKLLYYLNRHIELDGDEHGPISLKMVENLCGDDNKKWTETLLTAKSALRHRIDLWSLISNAISRTKKEIATR
tara:strand:+ start:1413 stop:2252 length:840 start_codon:yes stop_codon:yes gene_type:complete